MFTHQIATSPRPMLDAFEVRAIGNCHVETLEAQRAFVLARAAIGSDVFDQEYQRGRNDQLHGAIAAARGERAPQKNAQPEEEEERFGLTRRELEIVELISQGLTNKDIAARLVISTRTAETHVQHILAKTGFSTRSQVAAWYAGKQSVLQRDD